MSARQGTHCPRCGLSAPPGAKFCSECGAALEAAATAPVTRQASRKVATVLFADIKGSTKAISAIDAETAMLLMRPMINAMAAAVREQGGTVIEVRGDGILSGFGALDSLEDHPLAACRAALAIRQAAKSGSSSSLPVRVGIHTGEVIVTPGEAGNSLMGASVHLASRLETAAEPNTILISEDVYRAVATAAEVQPRGRFTFKGFDHPVETWELLDVEHRSRWSARALLGLTPYCGRAPERALLKSFIEQTKGGAGGVLCITGDAGTGKSRFIHDALTSGSVDDCTIWFAESELPARHSPYAIARSIARSWLGLTDHNTALDVERRLSAILQQFADAILDHAPALKALLNLSVADTEWANFDLIERQRRLAACFLEISRLQARHRPLFVIVDDAQWCDPETLHVLSELARHLPAMSAGLILLERAGSEPPLLEDFAGASAIRLRELSGEETRDFLSVVLGSDASLEPVKAKLTEMAGGLPFFLEEAVRYLTRNGILVGEAGRYKVVAPAAALNIPETVEALVSSRISSLSPDLRSVLSAASIVGRTGPLALIARICDGSVAEVTPKLENLERQHILAISELKSETIFEFRHEFFRQVAYTMTLSSDRRILHAKTLRAAEVLFDNRISDWITFLAYHAALASLHADAARYCRIAAEHAVLASSYSAASEFCEQAVKHLDQLPQTVENIQASIDVRLLLRVAAGGTSDFQSWLHHLTKSIELAEQIGDMSRRLLALIHRTWALNFSSSAVDAVRAGEAAVGLAQALRIPSSEALARFALGQAHYANGGYRDAIESLTPATAWLTQGHEMEQLGTTGTTLVLCNMMQANSHAAMGHFRAAERELAHLEDGANRTGRSYDQVALAYGRGMVWGGQARLEQTITALETAYELCRRHGINLFLPLVSASLSAVLVAVRNVARASEVAELGLEVADRLGHNVARTAATAALAGVRIAEANYREAIRLASEARSAASAYGHRGVEIAATRVLAQAFLASKPADVERPLYLLREAIELGESIEAIPAVASCGLVLITTLSRSGQREEAVRSAQHLLALTAERDMPGPTARLREFMAELGAGSG